MPHRALNARSAGRPPTRRAALLEFAVLGLLHDTPLHGYELRKRLGSALGIFRALSYGSLYPCLRALLDAGLIHDSTDSAPEGASVPVSRRPLRILEGRRSRLEERLANVREASARNRERMDGYTLALQAHGEEGAEREVRWLEELITLERRATQDPGPAPPDLPRSTASGHLQATGPDTNTTNPTTPEN